MCPRPRAAVLAALALVGIPAVAGPGGAASARPAPPLLRLSDDALVALATDGGPASEVIVIEGAAPAVPVTASERTVDEATLAATPRRTADDLLRVVPGLHLSRHGAEGKGAQFFLRGFDAVHGADLEVRVAGVPINEPSNVHGHGYVDLGFLIPEVVGELRAREGSFALAQGDFATAGTVDFELATSWRGARVAYEAGATGRHRVVAILAPTGGPREELVAVEALHDDGFGVNRGSERVALIAQTRLRAGVGWLEPVAFAHAGGFGSPGVLPLADVRAGRVALDGAYATGRGGSRRLLVGLRGGRSELTGGVWLGWRGLELDENFTGYLLHPVEGDRRRQTHAATEGGAHAGWHRALAPWLDVVAGGELRAVALHQTEDGLTAAGASWRQARVLRATTLGAGARAGFEARRGPLRVAAGLRADAVVIAADDLLAERTGRGRRAAVSPRLSAAWERAALGLFAAYGRGLRSPEARAFVPATPGDDPRLYDGGDPAITASDAVELGVRVGRGPVTASAAGFATFIAREALFDHVSGVTVVLDGTRRVGAQAAVTWSPARWLRARGDVTAVDARFVASGNPVPGPPRWLGRAGATLARGPWSAGLLLTHAGARPLAHGATGAASSLLDATAGWRGRHAAVELAIDNALGRAWHEGEYHFASRWDPGEPSSVLPRIHVSAGRPLGARLTVTVWL